MSVLCRTLGEKNNKQQSMHALATTVVYRLPLSLLMESRFAPALITSSKPPKYTDVTFASTPELFY